MLDCAVPQNFGCYEFCGTRGELSGEIDEVAASGEADAVGVGFLGSVVHNDSSVCDRAVMWNIAYLIVGEDVDGIGARCEDVDGIGARCACEFVTLG